MERLKASLVSWREITQGNVFTQRNRQWLIFSCPTWGSDGQTEASEAHVICMAADALYKEHVYNL